MIAVDRAKFAAGGNVEWGVAEAVTVSRPAGGRIEVDPWDFAMFQRSAVLPETGTRRAPLRS